jgi:hypothetical protein
VLLQQSYSTELYQDFHCYVNYIQIGQFRPKDGRVPVLDNTKEYVLMPGMSLTIGAEWTTISSPAGSVFSLSGNSLEIEICWMARMKEVFLWGDKSNIL